MSSISSRVTRLLAEAKKIVWRPNVILLSGAEGAYTLEIRSWDGVPGSARKDEHTQNFTFAAKAEAKDFVEGMLSYWNKRYGLDRSAILMLDISVPTDAEAKEICKRQRPLALEAEAEREGISLADKLHQVYGQDADLETLPVWGDILRWEKEDRAGA